MDSDERHKTNDNRQRLFGRGDPARLIAFVCECGDRDCHRTVPLIVTEYEARRPGPILAGGHAPAGSRSRVVGDGRGVPEVEPTPEVDEVAAGDHE